MSKFRCTICGYVHDGVFAPEACPVCRAKTFKEILEDAPYACEHIVGIAKDLDPQVVQGLLDNFNGECTEVGMYLAMSRQADREGYPDVAEAFKRYAFEEAEHAAKFAELLGNCLSNSTEKNLKMRMDAEAGACEGKFKLAKLAKTLDYDAVHDTVHEMAKDEARHGAGFRGLYNKYFKKH